MSLNLDSSAIQSWQQEQLLLGELGWGGGETADQRGRMNGHVSGKCSLRILELILDMNHSLHELGRRIIRCPET